MATAAHRNFCAGRAQRTVGALVAWAANRRLNSALGEEKALLWAPRTCSAIALSR